ncbi:MAG: glycogen debranching protein GlgX [Alphaproteobacteria bacterium]|nr:glycogen debranching protein GlgX [Alphaproteobacteria bacterium]
MVRFNVLEGKSYPLGSTPDAEGVNFAIYSAHAERVELCLFDESGSQEIEHYEITESDNNIWHIYLQGAKVGQVYGYRVYGPYKPEEGFRFNPYKLLLDPYAKQLVGKLIWHKAIFGYDIDSAEKDLSFSTLDSAPYVPKSVVIDESFDWQGDIHPQHSMEETVIYETHMRGYTKLHPQVPDAERGRFAGFGNDAVLNHLENLGITAVEFLPIHAFLGNRHKKGYIKDNYWGYESFSFFAPEQHYLVHGDIKEFKQLVKKMHGRGIEVLLDVVYNHTGEGNEQGPTLCYRGIDNSSYYMLNPDNKRYYYDSTGCGASFNLQNRHVLKLVMDSLRYWVDKMHVDGFRFDLAPTLCRIDRNFTQKSGFLYAATQDETLSKAKLIAEPWDVGYGGYQVGAFPEGWAEWNDKYRDVVRRFWKGDHYQTAELASRLAGSSDIFNYYNRNIWSSINFVTAHDGFNLHDLVSYNSKHNQSNGENNRDGTDSNWSWNSGAEGETENKQIIENRYCRMRAMLATLFLSFGTPMLVAGDEFAQPQFGNNNPYCQDNVITWIAWEALSSKNFALMEFVKKLIKLRKECPIFKRKHFFTGKVLKENIKDITWYNEHGQEMTTEDWQDGNRRALSYTIYAENKFYTCILNANFYDMEWKLPSIGGRKVWNLLVDSSAKFENEKKIMAGSVLNIPAWGVLLFEVKN